MLCVTKYVGRRQVLWRDPSNGTGIYDSEVGKPQGKRPLGISRALRCETGSLNGPVVGFVNVQTR
jgi:hypothetical protein